MTRDTVTVPREAWAEVRHFVEWRATDSGTTRDLLNRIDVAAPSSDPEGGARGVQGSIATKQATDLTSALATETALEILEQECWDLRCVNVPTGGDDYDIGWRVIEHYQAEPQERIIGYGNSPLEAMRDALETAEKRRHG